MNAIRNATIEDFIGTAGGKVMYLAYTRQDTSDRRPLLNITEFVDECVMTGRRGVSCNESYDPAISARVGNESTITCTLYDTRFDLEFRPYSYYLEPRIYIANRSTKYAKH